MRRAITVVVFFIAMQLAVAILAIGGVIAYQSIMGFPVSLRMIQVGMSTATVQTIASIGSCMIVMALLFYKKYVSWQMFFWREASIGVQALSIPLLLCFSFAVNMIAEVIDFPDVTLPVVMEMLSTPAGLFAIVILAPLCEELIFRGCILDGFLRQGKSPLYAILMSSLFFGIIHFNPAQSFFAFILGLVLGWVYYRTGSVLPGIVMHFVNNAGVAVSYYLTGDMGDGFSTVLGGGLLFWAAVVGLFALSYLLYWVMSRKLPAAPVYYIEN